MIKPGFEAMAYQEINHLIDEGEGILETCSPENFTKSGGPEVRRNAIELWLTKAERQTGNLSVDSEDAIRFSVARFNEQIESLDPHPPSVAQLRHAFVDLVNEKLRLLNAMIGREAEE